MKTIEERIDKLEGAVEAIMEVLKCLIPYDGSHYKSLNKYDFNIEEENDVRD
jgi:tetrahydromethanopterin S-methyltransferase subunit B